MAKFIILTGGEFELTEIEPELMDKLHSSLQADVEAYPTYYCGDMFWPKNTQGWVIIDRPEVPKPNLVIATRSAR